MALGVTVDEPGSGAFEPDSGEQPTVGETSDAWMPPGDEATEGSAPDSDAP
jgi:hypothetical protein